MDPPAPSCHFRAFSWLPGAGLYRDARLRRVVACAEDAGRWEVVRGRVDGAREGFFEGGWSLTAPWDEAVEVHVWQGRIAHGQPGEPLAEVRGAVGWMWPGPGPLVLDRSLTHVGTAPRWPVPVLGEAVPAAPAPVRLDPAVEMRPIARFGLADPGSLEAVAWEVAGATAPEVLRSSDDFDREHEAPVGAHVGPACWRVSWPEGTAGLILWKRYDRFHGRQRARVLVDGRPVGWWYAPLEDRDRRWAWSRFGIDGEDLPPAGEATFTIDPLPGTPLWSVSEIEVLALVRRDVP